MTPRPEEGSGERPYARADAPAPGRGSVKDHVRCVAVTEAQGIGLARS
jgi:hypothetical protein